VTLKNNLFIFDILTKPTEQGFNTATPNNMKLTEVLGIKTGVKNVVLTGKPEITNFTTSDNEPYYVVRTKEPIKVFCSVDKDIEPFVTDEVYVRESSIGLDTWEFVNKEKPEEGFYMPGWVVDFSKGQELAILQDTTIASWSKAGRKERIASNRMSINERIKERQKARGEKKD
jgi:hypothetical protein